jgi:hypothetical protein
LGPINIYPNPTTDRWNLSFANGSILRAEIFNMEGRVLDIIEGNGETMLEINANNYADGIYTAKITTAKGSKVIRLVKY